MKKIPIGIMNYRDLITNDYYYVDKTLMIKDFLERKSKVTLIIRPRRFGKTLNMSMMSEFFDITKNSKEIFKNTHIMNSHYIHEMNSYPTIFISFAGAKGNMNNIIEYLKNEFQREYEQYEFIFNDMSQFDKREYNMIIDFLMKTDNSLQGFSDCLSFLMKMLEKYYHKKVMLFIDEYDTPFIEAHVGGFYQDIKGGLASLLHNSLKLLSSLQYAMLTGIQRVAKENIFSDLNNLVVCTVADDEYSQYFGFTEEETKQLLKYYDLELSEEVKEMYDGYHIGNQDIYNPWSIINYASRKKLISYWVNTSANKMIKNAIRDSDSSFSQEYERLLINTQITTQVTLETSFYEQESTSSLWGLLVNAGYLTIIETVSSMDNWYKIEIPNIEVQKEFISLTEYYLSINDGKLSRMMRYLMDRDKELFIQEYRNILQLPSYYDLKDENSYHMLLLGMCICLSNQYEIISNRESGQGRCDIILKAKKDMPSYVMEFKYTKDEKVNLETLANEAIQQIIDRGYDHEVTGKVIYIGLAHCQKDVKMKWLERK